MALRSDRANRKMWPMLRDLARQVQCPVNGVMTYMEPEDWKDVMTAIWNKEARMAECDGRVVLLGLRTSRLETADMAGLIDFIHAFGAQRGVRWSDPEEAAAMQEYEQR